MTTTELSYDELRDALDGFKAWDGGCVSSGIHDALLRERVFAFIKAMPQKARTAFLADHVYQMTLSPSALAQGYTLEDARELLAWLDENDLS